MITPYYDQEGTQIYQGDCLEIMPTLEANSVDSIVTDPPYGLSFMGKDWDHGVPGSPFWIEALRVAKPGAFMLAFGGTRTFHRLTCAIEDAGWEIRDCVMWVYGSGFPKSHNIGKAIDKANGRKFEDRFALGRHIREQREAHGMTRSQVNKELGAATKCDHYESDSMGFARVPTVADWNILQPLLDLSMEWCELIERVEAERGVVGENPWTNSVHHFVPGKDHTERIQLNITVPATDAAKQWEGWGTALKPSWEPIIVARKPFKGTVAENVLKWRTGGINIDGCRVGNEIHEVGMAGRKADFWACSNNKKMIINKMVQGRFPANLIHDGSDEVVGLFPSPHGAGFKRNGGLSKDGGSIFCGNFEGNGMRFGDSGSAARYFKCCPSDEIMVDKTGFSMYDIDILNEGGISICGYTLENQKEGIIVIGVIRATERFTVAVEQLLCGNNATECIQRDIVSTIKTMIKLTTELTTLNVSRSKNTTIFMQESEKITRLLTELNIGNVSDAENISRLIVFKNAVLGHIKDIVRSANVKNYENGERKIETIGTHIIENTASRIKYCAKASKRDRDEGCEGMESTIPQRYGEMKGTEEHAPNRQNMQKNVHPTVKPTTLMRYLCRLVTPPNGLILDPFTGSGSTGKAAILERFKFIGIELEMESVEIAVKRLPKKGFPL